MFVMTNQCVTNRQLIGSNRNCLVIKTLSYQYSNSHYKDKTVSRLSCLYSGDSVNMGIRSLYWERVLRDTSGDALHDTTTKHQTCHYDDVIIGAMESQNTSLTIVYSTVYSNADQRKHKISASLAFVRGIHRGPVNSPHKWPISRKMFPFHDVIMTMRAMYSS